MSGYILWHNPRCSKSRATLNLLESRGITPTIRLYLEESPSADELRAAIAMLGVPVSEVVRRGEKTWRELGLKDADDEDLLAAMVDHPILIERPILFANGQAAIGRPPENVLGLIV